MATTPQAVAIYARISRDDDGGGAGVGRQVEDCRKLAESLGWPVAGAYVDNDISAYSGKKRPEYQRMLTDLGDGFVDGVIVYHMDRLTRRPIELETFLGVVDAAKVSHVRFVTGEANVNTGDGLLVARLLAAVAANESDSKSRRVKRKYEEIAASGVPHPGSSRPFGYEPDKVTINETEAQVLRTLAARFLAGESTTSLVRWLQAEEVKTVYNMDWRTGTVRTMLTNPRYAGFRVHRGQVIGPAQWKPILSEDTHRQILAKMAEKKSTGRRIPQRYLLSGLLRCGKCGHRLYSNARQNSRRYVCSSSPDHGGCGRLTVVADPVERLIADAVLYRLDTPELADALAGRASADERAHALRVEVDQAQVQLEELANAYAARAISMPEWMTARAPIQQRLANAQRALGHATQTTALSGLVGNADSLRSTWSTLNLSRQHEIVRAVLDHAVIGPGALGARELDPARVSPVWRL